MKTHNIIGVLVMAILLLSLATTVYADDPPKSSNNSSKPVNPPPAVKGTFDPVPIHPVTDTLDLTGVNLTSFAGAEETKSSVPVEPPQVGPFSKGSSEPGAIMMGQINPKTAQIVPNTLNFASDFIAGQAAQQTSSQRNVNAASSTFIMTQNFEGNFPPTPPGGWSVTDPGGTGHLWDDVNCFAIESSGTGWSAWPADEGVNGLDPCSGDNYANNMNSWLIFGPFSLADAQSASLDFFFRIESESGFDYLRWLASVDGNSFYGFEVSGTHAGGPFSNGYNFASFDLTNVPTLGDLSGRPNVWIAFRFVSDGSITARGPFIDSISLRKNTDSRVYLTLEDFDVIDFPNQQWESFDRDGPTNGDYRWDDVFSEGNTNACHSRSGDWSMWPADNGANALDVCGGATYPHNASSWLVHGPLNLSGSSEAWVDFYFRNESEVEYDRFWWTVSVGDTDNYWGFWISGDQTRGPDEGFNFMRFDLSNVPGLGDLRGQPEVWLAFIFDSDDSIISGQGPFLDDVRVVVERPVSEVGISPLYLPLVLKGPVEPQTILYVDNRTTGNVSYTVTGIPEGNITCSNLPPGGPHFCGIFTHGTYQVLVETTQCGQNSGEVEFLAGNVTRTVRCVSNPS